MKTNGAVAHFSILSPEFLPLQFGNRFMLDSKAVFSNFIFGEEPLNTPTSENIYRPEKDDSWEPFCHHLWGGSVTVQNKHKDNTATIQTDQDKTKRQMVTHRD